MDGAELGTFPTDAGPVDLVFDGQAIWVANSAAHTVTKLALNGKQLGIFPVGFNPSYVPQVPDGAI